MSSSPTASVVAEWMLNELQRAKQLYQEDAVYDIERKFGTRFTYTNENGNPAIDREVLKAFRELTGDSVVWERSERVWRKRERRDVRGRQQD